MLPFLFLVKNMKLIDNYISIKNGNGMNKMERKYRQAWEDKDLINLVVTVLNYTANSRTKADAFRQAARLLGRTPSACETQYYSVPKRLKHVAERIHESSNQAIADLDSGPVKLTRVFLGEKGVNTNLVHIQPVKPKTALKQLALSIDLANNESLKVFDFGFGHKEFVVTDEKETIGYVVVTENKKVIGCQCSDRLKDGIICKHMVKVALDKDLEVF